MSRAREQLAIGILNLYALAAAYLFFAVGLPWLAGLLDTVPWWWGPISA